MKWYRCVSVIAGLMLVLTANAAQADVFNTGQGLTSLDFVTVGNPGNVADTHGDGYGAVDYVYQIGKYEVTAGQYTTFLNDVAAADTYGLYNGWMSTSSSFGFGCGIDRSGTSGSYTYSVGGDRANRPVNLVSWGDAARFMNWLHNGQGNVSTETGAYTLDGAMTRVELMDITRNTDAKYWIPTGDEWYKAAYYDPNKSGEGVGGYWDYPTKHDSPNVPDGIDSAQDTEFDAVFDDGARLSNPNSVDNAGVLSAYGTMGQGGNVWEWNETAMTSSSRGLRGSDWKGDSDYLLASTRLTSAWPTYEDFYFGFRVASVPEPGSLTLMLFGALAGLYWWRHRK